MKYIFIVGTGRTGTLFLESFFSDQTRDCYAVQEPSHRIKLISNLYLSGKLSEFFLRRYLKRYKRKVDRKLSKQSKNIYIQIDAWLIGFTGVLEEVFDSPYIIHLTRNPLTYIPSISNRYYKERIKGFFRDVIPYWKLRGNRTGHYSRKEWRLLSNEEKMAWHWNIHNSFIEQYKANMKHYLFIRYEDLFASGNSGLRSIVKFCNLELNEGAYDIIEKREKLNTANSKFPEFDDWPNDIKERVINLCQPLISKYEYYK